MQIWHFSSFLDSLLTQSKSKTIMQLSDLWWHYCSEITFIERIALLNFLDPAYSIFNLFSYFRAFRNIFFKHIKCPSFGLILEDRDIKARGFKRGAFCICLVDSNWLILRARHKRYAVLWNSVSQPPWTSLV